MGCSARIASSVARQRVINFHLFLAKSVLIRAGWRLQKYFKKLEKNSLLKTTHVVKE